MRLVELTPKAEAELADILGSSRRRFGLAAAGRYLDLIEAAFDAIAEDPLRPSAGLIVRGGRQVQIYDLRLARERVSAEGRVTRPRHIIYYELKNERLHVLRIVHDSMDQRQLRLPRIDSL